jgi:hypothetical protein
LELEPGEDLLAALGRDGHVLFLLDLLSSARLTIAVRLRPLVSNNC